MLSGNVFIIDQGSTADRSPLKRINYSLLFKKTKKEKEVVGVASFEELNFPSRDGYVVFLKDKINGIANRSDQLTIPVS